MYDNRIDHIQTDTDEMILLATNSSNMIFNNLPSAQKQMTFFKSTLFFLIVLLSSDLASQNTCDTLRGYKVGANMNDSFPFYPKTIGAAYSDYRMQYSDISRFGEDYSISTSNKFGENATPALSTTLSFDLIYSKLHINRSSGYDFRDVKFKRLAKDRIFSHTPLGSNQFIISGTTQDSPPPAPGSLTINSTKGTIIYTNSDGSDNKVLLTQSGEAPVQDGDVILKTIVKDDYIYAIGYKIIVNMFTPSTPMRQGILYVIHNSVFSSIDNTKYYCSGIPGGSLVRQFRIHNLVTDILVEQDGSIYVSGMSDRMNGSTGFIGKVNLNTNTAKFRHYHANPFFGGAVNNAPVIMTNLLKGNNPNEYYSLYKFLGFTNTATMGVLRFDDDLNELDLKQFEIDWGNHWSDAFPTSIEIDPYDNLFIGAYMKNRLCLGSTGPPCSFQHFSFKYNLNQPLVGAYQRIYGYKDYGFVQLDQDPFVGTGGGINSLTTLGKLSRTIVLNSAGDSIHVAYLLSEIGNPKKTILNHYKRSTDYYINPLITGADECAGNICTRDTFQAHIDTANIKTASIRDFSDFNSPPNYLGGADQNFYEVYTCKITKSSMEARWHEEYPVVCGNKVYDSAVGCDFWAGIHVRSGSDTLCKSNDDTLSIMFRSPFGRNTYEWYEANNPGNILSTEPFLNIKKAGFYIISCTRHLSNGSTCSQSFGKTIYPAEVANMVFTPSNIMCQNGQTMISVSNLKPITYLWDALPLGSVINQGGQTALAIDTGICSVQIEYSNGCRDTIHGNVKRDGLHITQGMTESGTPFETYVVYVCNLNVVSATNVVVNFTSSANFEPVLPLPPGWSQSGTQFSYTIPVIPGLSPSGIPNCEMIMLPIKANKCPTSHTVGASTSSPAFTCGSASKTDVFWIQNDFTATLTSSKDLECFGQPITMTASPLGGSYDWKENGITQGYFQNLSQQVINFTSGVTTSVITVDITKNQCKKSVTKTIKMATDPWAGGATIVSKSCNPSNVAGSIMVPITLPAQHTYLWSNGATTQNLTGLEPITTQTYILTVTNTHGCAYVSTYSVGNLSPIQANIKISTNCATTPVLTAIPSGGVAPYTFEWRRVSNGSLTSTSNTINMPTFGATLKVTDANGCTRIVPVPSAIPPTIITPSTIPTNTIFNNQRVIISGDVPVTSTWRFTDCEVILNLHSDGLTLASPVAGRAEVYLTNSHLHTCNSTMARGIRMTKHNDVCYPKNSKIEDMYAGIEVFPASGHSTGTFYLAAENTTFKNNFIGIRIQAPTATIVQQNIPILNSSPPAVQFVPNYFAGNTFEGSPTIKTYNLAGYPSTSLMTNLEKAYVATNWGSYAAVVSNCQNNFDIGVETNPILGFFPVLNTIKNLANGILLENAKANVLNTQFLNLNPASTITNTNSSFFHRGIGIFARGTAATTQKLTVRGPNSPSPDMSNVRNGILTQDMNIDVQNMKINSTIGDRGISFERDTARPMTVKTIIKNNQIKAPKPILGKRELNDEILIQSNAIEDMSPANTTGALIDIQSMAHHLGRIWPAQPRCQILSNNLTINLSRFGVRKTGIHRVSDSFISQINGNHIKIQNASPSPNFTYAGIYTDNIKKLDVEANTIYQTTNTTLGNYSTAIGNPFLSVYPVGIFTQQISNMNVNCNNLYTRTGSLHKDDHTNFDLFTNNYVSTNYGAAFINYPSNSSTIRGNSNRFYCSIPATQFMKHYITQPGMIVKTGFGASQPGSPFPTPCTAPIPYCTANPTFAPNSFSFYPTALVGGFTNNGTSPATGDLTCRIICYQPKLGLFASTMNESLELRTDIYPNPTHGDVSVRFVNLSDDQKTADITLIDAQGRTVHSKTYDIRDQKVDVSFSGRSAGIYHLQIRIAGQSNFNHKLIIEL